MSAVARTGWSVASIASVAFALVLGGCAGTEDSRSSTESTRADAARSGSTTTTALGVGCNGAHELNQDDDVALEALLQRSQLPAGEWTTAETPPCPWALSADELLVVPECLAAATAADAPANDEARNGNARVTFARDGGVQLDDRLEIYTSRQNVDAIRAILSGASTSDCYAAALRRRAALERATTIRDVHVERFAAAPDAAALGLGLPATAGYAADAGFVDGLNITFTRTTKHTSEPVTMRVVTFGGGGFVSTVTLIGTTPADLDAIDLTGVLQAAAQNYRAMLDPNH